MKTMPTLFVSHGGGPWPYMPDWRKEFQRTADWLNRLPETLPERPRAILSISGHWEEDELTVSTAERPAMVFDYYGFPEHTYHISYPAPGSPSVAHRVQELLVGRGIACRTDSERGFDHGTFVPLVLMYPNADIPVVSMSIKSSYDPQEHIALGEALRPLRDEGVLIMGSGLSFHNLRAFGPAGSAVSDEFEAWLTRAVTMENPQVRREQLENWEKAPSARLAHPREDHLIPLMVASGAAGDQQGHRIFVDRVRSITMASYQFGT